MGEPSYPLTNQLWLPPGLTTSPPRVLPMARGLLTPRPTMVESDTPATVDSAILAMVDTMARGLLTPRPTMVESDTLAMVDSAILVMGYYGKRSADSEAYYGGVGYAGYGGLGYAGYGGYYGKRSADSEAYYGGLGYAGYGGYGYGAGYGYLG